MKTIKLSSKEIEFIRNQYLVELEEAEQYIKNLKNILEKVGLPEPQQVSKEPVAKPVARRGRKPKVRPEGITPVAEKVKKGRKPRSDKGVKRGRKAKPVVEKPVPAKPVTAPVPPKTKEKTPKPPKPVKAASKKQIRRRNPKQRRVIKLTRLSKPLPKKEVKPAEPLTPAAESTPESAQ